MLSAVKSISSTAEAAEHTGVDAGGDVIERALRLGSGVVGCPFVFTEAGSVADAGGGRSAALPVHSFEATAPVLDPEGRRLGTVRAVDLAGRPTFHAREAHAVCDVAELIAADFRARGPIGDFDHVTGLPNRRRFERDFPEVSRQGEAYLALVTIADAPHFNQILRALGHSCSEGFIRRGAEMIKAVVGDTVQVYHVSVLSFAFMAIGGSILAREIVRSFSEPIVCGGLPIATRIGVGLTRLDPERVNTAETLRAALAAAQDSRHSAEGYAFYDRQTDAAHVRAFRLLTDLDEALRDYGQLSLVYQPRFDLSSGGVRGAEALVRWRHPTLGPVAPAEFIPLAETTALMGPITDFVMTRACRQLSAWRREGLDLQMSINVSPNSLHDANFLERTDRILKFAGVAPDSIEFEFTEGVFTSPNAGVRANVDGVRARGVRVAIDDFGMGYSNLDSITRLPADVLKIDKSLVRSIDLDPRRRRLCRGMIELAQDLGFHVVAEGVETAGVYDMLADWRCDEGQGYYMSRPLAPVDFEAFVSAQPIARKPARARRAKAAVTP